MTGRIVVAGSINTDLVTFAEAMPGPGETVAARDFAVLPGGKGANQAVAAARLGGDVTLVGRVGDDAFGRDALTRLAAAGVATGLVRVSAGVPSGIRSRPSDRR